MSFVEPIRKIAKYIKVYFDTKFTCVYFACQPSYDPKLVKLRVLLSSLHSQHGLNDGQHSLQPRCRTPLTRG